MALRPTCDVFLTAVEGVKRYAVVITEVSAEVTAEQIDNDAVVKDLCPRALERLKAKIIAGTTPPVERKKKDAAPGDAALAK